MTTSHPPRADDWREEAACRQADPELFFPTAAGGARYRSQVDRALAICAACPARSACLDWAVDRLPEGIAGGTTEAQRRRIRAERRTARQEDGRIRVPRGAGRQERAEAGRAALVAGHQPAEVAVRFGVHPRTVQRWAHRAGVPAPFRAAARARGAAR